MTSEPARPREAFVWTWLPGAAGPIAAGRLVRVDAEAHFVYGRSYRERADAIPLYLPEVPLGNGKLRPPPGLAMASAPSDAASETPRHGTWLRSPRDPSDWPA